MSYNMQYKFKIALLYAVEGPGGPFLDRGRSWTGPSKTGEVSEGAFMDRGRSWKVFTEVKVHLWAFLDKGRSLKGFHEGNVHLGPSWIGEI